MIKEYIINALTVITVVFIIMVALFSMVKVNRATEAKYVEAGLIQCPSQIDRQYWYWTKPDNCGTIR